MSASHEIAVRHFGRKTVTALSRKGIVLLGLVTIPGDGPMSFTNTDTGYIVNDNGTGRVWTYSEVMRNAQI
jgi:hypothetical protein